MGKSLNALTRGEPLAALVDRYRRVSKPEQTAILNELVKLLGCHRKHAIRLLAEGPSERASRPGRRVYDEAVKEVLIILWEASDRLCNKRLRAFSRFGADSVVVVELAGARLPDHTVGLIERNHLESYRTGMMLSGFAGNHPCAFLVPKFDNCDDVTTTDCFVAKSGQR